MSGNHWCPTATESIVAAGVDQLTPSGELRTKIFDWPPAAVLAAHTTWTPVASAATADELKNRENVNPVGHANGPSPQSEAKVPAYWLESNCTIEATRTGRPKVRPPSVDFTSQMSVLGFEVDGYSMNVTYSAPSGPTATSANDAVPCSTGVARTGCSNVSPWSVERETRTALFPACPVYCDHAMYTLPEYGPAVWSTAMLSLSWKSPLASKRADGTPFFTSTVRS